MGYRGSAPMRIKRVSRLVNLGNVSHGCYADGGVGRVD